MVAWEQKTFSGHPKTETDTETDADHKRCFYYFGKVGKVQAMSCLSSELSFRVKKCLFVFINT